MKAIRILQCDCGHSLRFGASRCGHCYRATPARNQIWFWLAGFGGLIALFALLIS